MTRKEFEGQVFKEAENVIEIEYWKSAALDVKGHTTVLFDGAIRYTDAMQIGVIMGGSGAGVIISTYRDMMEMASSYVRIDEYAAMPDESRITITREEWEKENKSAE